MPATDFLALEGPKCAVLGQPIAHSLSPVLHSAGYRALGLEFSYVRIEAGQARDVRRLLEAADDQVRGFSVTMPIKQDALELSDVATERALQIGSANTLVPTAEGGWLADNTDVDGVTACLVSLQRQGVVIDGTKAVVVGNGGTARPAVAALAAAGVQAVTVLARSERALNLQALVESCGMEFRWARFDDPSVKEMCAECSVAISTVPDHAASGLTHALLAAGAIIDVVYDPYPTTLLSAARAAGLPHADGLRMLAGQAEEQFRLFTGHPAPQGLMLEAVLQARPHGS
ncbi:MAG TPA: shikimate dehydrogenase [Candidatus Corynebacterium gallistercoris]|uniref:Shikimate dehydrogenase n=1 Tax=Candidatus Corynebacterium gallistercoris TaxID=2838530 RepID=A0A9D1UQM7_9CORY|nr:shikimate dehydrogenase [Candidatus Corynebacterium gallistercoris]